MTDKQIYFDMSLVRHLQEEVVPIDEGDMLVGKKGPIDTGSNFGKVCPECMKPITDCICAKDIPEAKATCTRCTKPLAAGSKVCSECGYMNESKVNESEWFTKEELAKLKARLTKVRAMYKKYKDNDKYKREGISIEKDIRELEQKLKDMQTTVEAPKEVKEDVETMPETEPITKPETEPAPTKTPMPRTPNWPQPNVNPKPKARTPSQEAFIKARESKIIKVTKKV